MAVKKSVFSFVAALTTAVLAASSAIATDAFGVMEELLSSN